MRRKPPSVFTSFNYESDDDTPIPSSKGKNREDKSKNGRNSTKNKENSLLKQLAMGGTNKKSKKKKKKGAIMEQPNEKSSVLLSGQDEHIHHDSTEGSNTLMKELSHQSSESSYVTKEKANRHWMHVVADTLPRSTSSKQSTAQSSVVFQDQGLQEDAIEKDKGIRYIPEVVQIVNHNEVNSVHMSHIVDMIKSQEDHIKVLLAEINQLTINNNNLKGYLHHEIEEKHFMNREIEEMKRLNSQYGSEMNALQLEIQRLRSRF